MTEKCPYCDGDESKCDFSFETERCSQMAEPNNAWRGINSAPRDGTHILACRIPIGIRVTFQTHPPTVVHWFDDPDDPGFYTSVNELAPEHPFEATHWKPLGPPPLALSSKSETDSQLREAAESFLDAMASPLPSQERQT